MPEGMLWLVTLAQDSGVFGSCVSTVVLWRMRGSLASRWRGGMRCCVRIWTSGSVVCCSARRRRSWAGRDQGGCGGDRGASGHGGQGARELEGPGAAGVEPAGRVRAPGGGRSWPPRPTRARAGVDRAGRSGDPRGPESPLVWTTKSTRNLADALAAGGHPVSDRTVARMLRAQGFSLQANAKVTEGRQHVDRDAQFGYLNTRVSDHLAAGAPVLSVDTKKKELVGEFQNGGREYQPTGSPGAGERARLPGQGTGQGDPVRHL